MIDNIKKSLTAAYSMLIYHSFTLIIEIILVGVIQVAFEYGDRKIYLFVYLLGLLFHNNVVKLLSWSFQSKEEK